VQLHAAAIGVDLNLIRLNFRSGEHMKSEYSKINPEHTLPTIVDGNFILWESHAIMIYLQDKYGKDDSFYPKDPQARAVINQRLYFEMGTLSMAFNDHFIQPVFGESTNDANLKRVEEAFRLLDIFLEGSGFVANNKLSIADLSILTTVSSIEVFGFNLKRYPNVTRWLKLMKTTIPSYEINQAGVDLLKQMLIKVFL